MNKKWSLPSANPQIKSSEEIISFLLTQRGIFSQTARNEFFRPDLNSITPAGVGISKTNLDKTIKRLKKALGQKELVIVYGDYDVDGITGTAILWETLIALGFEVMPYIPHRVEEGYGLSEKGIENLLSQYPQTKLIITVDNGIVAHQAVEYAKERAIDVIITDHHLPESKDSKPSAYAIVHTTTLCGAGVAWLLGKEIEKEFGSVGRNDEDRYLELAALATVADLVPLTQANRSIVWHGLKKLSETKRLGLIELYLRSTIDASRIGTYEIGHVIGPRLNAAGRLESAMDSLRLLCTRDRKRARDLAEHLDITNTERQRIMRVSVEHAKDIVHQRTEMKKIIIVAEESYEEGIIGLIAGKLVEEFYRPAIVIAKGEEKSKGSVRSVAGFNIIEFLRSKSELFINLGGHPMAAGFSISTHNLIEFQNTIEQLAGEVITDSLLQRKITIDVVIPFNSISQELYQEIKKFEPFGMANPQPVFLSDRVLVREKRLMGRENQHMRLILQGGEVGTVLEAVAFNMGDRSAEIAEESYIDIVYTLDENEWKGNTRLQLKIKDFRLS